MSAERKGGESCISQNHRQFAMRDKATATSSFNQRTSAMSAAEAANSTSLRKILSVRDDGYIIFDT